MSSQPLASVASRQAALVTLSGDALAGDIRRQWDALEQANARGGVGEREPVRHTNLGPVREGKGGAKRRKPKHGRG